MASRSFCFNGVRAGFAAWLCGWLLATGFVCWHALLVQRYLDRVTATRFSADAPGTPFQRVPQAIAPDGQTWVRHAVALAETGAWRLRSTAIDNAPDGRAVYWNSGWALWLEAGGRLRSAVTGEPLATAIENASLWANLPPFLIVMTLASVWAWRRWGAGALVAVALAGHRGFYEGFYPGYCDHHGLINACVLGAVLGALMAGGGWWKQSEAEAGRNLLPASERDVMRAATISAVCGAIGLWVSAASLVVTLAFIGIAATAMGMVYGRGGIPGMGCVPAAWRRWGRVGAALSLGFYLLENFPDRLGLRLEANHPLYSLAWWGAGECIAIVLAWRMGSRPLKGCPWRLLGWAALVLVAPLVIWVKGPAVFMPLDPFLGRIHRSIHEFEPLWTAVGRAGWRAYADQFLIWAGIGVLSAIWLARKPPSPEHIVVGFVAGVAVAATVLGCLQNRWLLTASAPQIALFVVLILLVAANCGGVRRAAFAVGGVVLFAAGPWTLVDERLLVERVRDVQWGETVQLLYRDIAGALRKAGAGDQSIVLADPNASVGVGYYGGFRTLGTLYWENRDGLRAAAEILDGVDDAETAARVHLKGVSHVAMVSSYDFLQEYHYALNGKTRAADDREGFGHGLLYGHRIPVWLRPIEYRVPEPLAPLGFKVALFAVDFSAPAAVAHQRIGIYQQGLGERALAEESFMASLAADASRPEPWFLIGRLMIDTRRTREAFNFFKAGVARAPERDRSALVRSVVNLLSDQGTEGQRLAEELSRSFSD